MTMIARTSLHSAVLKRRRAVVCSLDIRRVVSSSSSSSSSTNDNQRRRHQQQQRSSGESPSVSNRQNSVHHQLQQQPQQRQQRRHPNDAAAAASSSNGSSSSSSNNSKSKPWSPDKLIQSMQHQLHQLQREIVRDGMLESRPPVWFLHTSTTPYALGNTSTDDSRIDTEHTIMTTTRQNLQQQREWYSRAVDIAQMMQLQIEHALLQPSNRHRHEFAYLTELLLDIFNSLVPIRAAAAVPPPINDLTWTTTPASIENGQQFSGMQHHSGDDDNGDELLLYDYRTIVQLIHRHGLELSHSQCFSAIQMAARHGRWVEAADLYRSHTDPDASGYLPVVGTTRKTLSSSSSSSLLSTVQKQHHFTITGLYCMARAAIDTGMLPVESVLEGVTNLTLVSPSDSETYMLAAGVALGHAGQWDALRNYLKSSYKASQLGQPLVAATMHASVLCHRYDEALELFDELVTGELAAASEWQWNGGQDRLHPACRDLAMRALGGIYSVRDEPSDDIRQRVLQLYRDTQTEESKISIEALCAVLTCCGNDWEMVTELFLDVIYKNPTSWLVNGDECQMSTNKSHDEARNDQPLLQDMVPDLGSVIDNVMRVCNASQKYGTALLCLRLFDTSISSRVVPPYNHWMQQDAALQQQQQHSPIVRSIVPTLCAMKNRNDLLATTMVSLCGVQLHREAMHLFEAMESVPLLRNSTLSRRRTHDVYSYAESLVATTDSAASQTWETVHRHVHRLTASLSAIVSNDEPLTPLDLHLLSSALAAALREYSAASASDTGVLLGKWVERMPLRRPPDATAVFATVEADSVALALPLTDSLLSAVIEALALSGKIQQSENLVQSQLRTERDPSDWPLSYHEAIKLLFSQGQSEDGLALFRTIVATGGTPSLYCTAARNLIATGNWKPVLDLYRQSLTAGCTSEELSIRAMEAIAASGRIGPKDGQFPLLRSVISETAKSLGTTPAAWIESNYWKLKRILGFSVARLIMGWDDYKLCRLDELDLAVETLEKRSNAGLTAKNAVLFSIVQAAGNFEQYQVPYNATGLPNVPRDKDAWISTLEKTLQEAKQTRLMTEPNFILEVAVAFNRLGCYAECIELVNDALTRGLRLNTATLECAVKAAQNTDLTVSATDIQMMLRG